MASPAARGRRRRRCGSRGASPSPSRRAETASSKSRAVAGSTVKVGRSVRSRRGPRRDSAASAASPASTSNAARKAPPPELLAQQRLDRLAGVFGARRPLARRGRRAAPRWLPVLRAPVRWLAHRSSAASTPRARSSASSRVVPGMSRAFTSGWIPLPARLIAVRGEVLADRQLQRAAVGEADLLLEDALAEGARADHLRPRVVGQRRGEDLRRRGGVAVDQDDDRQRSAGCRRRSRRRRRPGSATRS